MGSPTPTDLGGLQVPDSQLRDPRQCLLRGRDQRRRHAHGTLAAPFATLGHAVSVAKAGATIVLRAGTYREALGVLRRKVTIQAYPHEQVWLSGSVVVSDWAQDLTDRPDGGVWEHTGWTTQFCQTVDPRAIDPNYPNAGLPDMVFVNGQPLAQVASLAAVGPGTFFVDYTQQAIYIGDDPTVAGTTVEASTQTYAMQFNAGASGSSLLGIGVEQYASDWNFSPIPAMVITNGATNVTFDRDVFAYSASRGLTLYGANSVVTNSVFIDNGYTGLHGNKADNVDVENNYVAGNNFEHFWAGFSPAASASGIKFTSTANTMIRNNIVQDNYANGIWFDVSSYNPTIVDNLTRGNDRNGIYVEITAYGIVASTCRSTTAKPGSSCRAPHSSASTTTHWPTTSPISSACTTTAESTPTRRSSPRASRGSRHQPVDEQHPGRANGGLDRTTILYRGSRQAEDRRRVVDDHRDGRQRVPALVVETAELTRHMDAYPADGHGSLREHQGAPRRHWLRPRQHRVHRLHDVAGVRQSRRWRLLTARDVTALASGQPLPSDIAAAVGVAATNTPDRARSCIR